MHAKSINDEGLLFELETLFGIGDVLGLRGKVFPLHQHPLRVTGTMERELREGMIETVSCVLVVFRQNPGQPSK